MINFNQALIHMRPKCTAKHEIVILLHDPSSSHTQRKRLQTTFLHLSRKSCLPTVLIQLGHIRKPLLFFNVSRILHEKFQQLRRCRKMLWWLDHLKRCIVFLGEHPQHEREVERMCSQRWHILCIKYFLPFSRIIRVFIMKKK